MESSVAEGVSRLIEEDVSCGFVFGEDFVEEFGVVATGCFEEEFGWFSSLVENPHQ